MTGRAPRKGETWCPDCYEGVMFKPCLLCEGSGVAGSALAACAECDGAGEVSVQPCETCGGAGFVTRAEMRLREVQRRLGDGPFHYFDGDAQVWTQTHHGITDYALACYLHFRKRLQAAAEINALQVRGVRTLVRDGGALLEATGVLLSVIRYPELRLFLSGLSWGYGGEGPRGFAAILQDLGRYPDEETALRVVAQIELHKAGWELPPGLAPIGPPGPNEGP